MIYPLRTVYLAGPISGLTHDEARYGWRKEFASLMPEHIHCNSPMRGKDFLEDVGVLLSKDFCKNTDAVNPMSTADGIMARDTNDVRMCDVLVICFLDSGGRISPGTLIEIGMGHMANKVMVIISKPDDPNVLHPMVISAANYMVETLEEGAVVVDKVLTPGL